MSAFLGGFSFTPKWSINLFQPMQKMLAFVDMFP